MLSSYKNTASIACTITKTLLTGIPNLFTQQTRNTVILKRKYPIRLHKKGALPHKLKHKDYIYEVVENTDLKKQLPLNIILTTYVEGYGEKGDQLSLKPNKAYNDFLLPGLAIYATPENLKKYSISNQTEEKTYSSLYVPKLLNELSKCFLTVKMSIENPWVIEKWHIRTNFRHVGFIVTDDSITLPQKEISGPNLDNEGKEFYITVTINKTESVNVRCKLHHTSSETSKQLPYVKDYYKIRGPALFPEDQEILDSIPKPKFEENV